MFVANYPKIQIEKGLHFDSFNGLILIQIQDPDSQFITPKLLEKFKEVHQFKFFDSEDESPTSISDQQAIEISKILLNAKNNNYDVIVHCHAGICRSGAVAECALLLGFEIPEDIELHKRIPNTLVFNKIRKALGFLYSWEN